jgi:hypothetical protein
MTTKINAVNSSAILPLVMLYSKQGFQRATPFWAIDGSDCGGRQGSHGADRIANAIPDRGRISPLLSPSCFGGTIACPTSEKVAEDGKPIKMANHWLAAERPLAGASSGM